MTDKAWFMRTFDAVVGEYADQGVELAKARDEVAHRYADAVETGQIAPVSSGLVETGRQSFNLFVKPAREARRQSMRKSAEDLIAALHNDGLLAEDDPILTQAFPLGDGRDKRLSDWAIADWQGARTERYRNAAAATESARGFDVDVAEEFIEALRKSGKRRTGQLFRAAS